MWFRRRFYHLINVTGDEKDLEYYIKEVGDILGVTRSLPAIDRSPKRIIEFIFHQIVEFRKLNQVSVVFIPISIINLELKDDDDEAVVMDGETAVGIPSLFDNEDDDDNPDKNDNNEPYFSDIDNYDDMND
jgi:hypothetical protein